MTAFSTKYYNLIPTKLISSCLFILLFWGCESPLPTPLRTQRNSLLVVDGIVTDVGHKQIFTIYKIESNLIEQRVSMIDAYVAIRFNGGEQQLTEISSREFVVPETFALTPGETYQLYIRYSEPDGEIVEVTSDVETAPLKAQPIDSIYYSIETNPVVRNGRYVYKKEIYYKINNPLEEKYFLFDFEETYEIKAGLDPNGSSCYITNSNPIELNLSQGKDIEEVTVFKRDLGSSAIFKRYRLNHSLLGLKYNISKKSYTYIQNVNAINNKSDSFFGFTPFQAKGNLTSSNNKTVLGYFLLASEANKRIVHTQAERQSFIRQFTGTENSSSNECRLNSAVPPNYCYDCLLMSGASSEKPDYF